MIECQGAKSTENEKGDKMGSKTVTLYLVDGDLAGTCTAEISNWTGKVVVVPRSRLSKLEGREDVKRPGAYCLYGPDPKNPQQQCVYIGEGDNVLARLKSHDKDKTFWTHAVIVISKDENLTKSHIRYLESSIIQMVMVAGRVTLDNMVVPPVPPMPEPDVSSMDYFLKQVQTIIYPSLGLNFLQPRPADADADAGNPRFDDEGNIDEKTGSRREGRVTYPKAQSRPPYAVPATPLPRRYSKKPDLTVDRYSSRSSIS